MTLEEAVDAMRNKIPVRSFGDRCLITVIHVYPDGLTMVEFDSLTKYDGGGRLPVEVISFFGYRATP